MSTLKQHQNGTCTCRKTKNTTNRMARACIVPGTREHGMVQMLAAAESAKPRRKK